MLQRRRRLDLHHKALGPQHGGEFRLQDLDGDLSVVLQILGKEDGGHAAFAEFAFDAIAVGESELQAGEDTAHFDDTGRGEMRHRKYSRAE